MKKLTNLLKFSILLIILSIPATTLRAQELLCQVNVQCPTCGGGNQVIFQDLQKAIQEYMNFTKWTEDKFEFEERIKVKMQVIINSWDQTQNYFQGTMQIQAIRPVYNATYETITLNFQDKHFNFNFSNFTNLQYSENNFTDNLSAMLNYYAYMILGFDYDSFSPAGGAPYFEKARNFVNLASSSSKEPGWKAFDGTQNRYWLAENMLNNSYRKLHDIMYIYHRQGLDGMEKDVNRGRGAILTSLKELQKLNTSYPAMYAPRVFLDGKTTELVTIFKNAFQNEKAELLQIMEDLDPSNLGKYQAINEK